MANDYFQFKQFTVYQDKCAMKVTTDGCLFGAIVASKIDSTNTGRKLNLETVLDIGTGTGLLTLMLAQKNQNIKIDAIEMDEDAAGQAIENTEASPWKDRISIIQADVRKYVFQKKYDLIISNPPFYENELRSPDDKKTMAQHGTGLHLPVLFDIIKKNLSIAGEFYVLLPYKRNEELRKLLADNNLEMHEILFIRQSVTHDYFRMVLAGGHASGNSGEIQIDELSIRDDKNNYTNEFNSLLKGYYLQL